MSHKDLIDRERLPAHIAIIMDGNGRWAKLHHQPRVFGHRNGVKAVRAVTEACAELGVGYLTLYAFSTENWSRPKFEVGALMELLVQTIRNEMNTLQENNVRLRAIGDVKLLPEKCHNELLEAIHTTQKNTGLTLILALNYSSRWEIGKAMKRMAQKISLGELSTKTIDENTIRNFLETAEYPDPELLVRTSGEERLSNFLLWQCAYTELYFTEVLWPDFGKEDLYEAIIDFQKRERRFGKTSEQVKMK